MILVDISVPGIGQNYDFQLNEHAQIKTVIEEISEMIGQKEQCVIGGDVKRLMLCDKVQRRVLPGDCTLLQCGISTGDSLILI